jgi:hypothetical protein
MVVLQIIEILIIMAVIVCFAVSMIKGVILNKNK